MNPDKWDWVDSLMGMMTGLVGGILSLFGWFHRQVSRTHERIDDLHERIGEHGTSIKVLEANHVAGLQRLDRIEEHITAISEKQDRQMEILVDLRQRH